MNIKGKGQRLIPEDLLKYLQNQKENGVGITQLVDSKGHPRFIEGSLTDLNSSVTFSYNKWSLSGTHLMVVLAGTIPANTSISQGQVIAKLSDSIPEWIYNKIYTVVGSSVIMSNFPTYNYSWASVTMSLALRKVDPTLDIRTMSNYSTTDERFFRIQFDLLIDSE